MRHVAIIGAGYAGMAAATEIARFGMPVSVFEAARVPGGRARRVEIDGIALDNGLHILIGAYRETLRLIELTRSPGEASGLLRLPLELIMHPEFRLKAPPLPAPFHLAAALLTARGLGIVGRLRAARFMLGMRARGFVLDRDTSVAELLAAWKQPERVNRLLWTPLCVSALNTPPGQASARIFLNVLRDSLDATRADSDLLLPTVDFSTLFPERALRYLASRGGKVWCGTTVQGFDAGTDGFTLQPQGGLFSHVILAVGPHRLDPLIAPHPQLVAAGRMVAKFRYQPIYSVYLQYRPGARLPFRMGGVVAEYAQWLFDRGQLCGQDGLIGVVISASGAHQDLSQDELARRVSAELAARFPDLGTPQWHRVIAEKRASFSCEPDLERPDNATSMPGVFLAGDYTASGYPATLEAAVRSGVRAASLVTQNA